MIQQVFAASYAGLLNLSSFFCGMTFSLDLGYDWLFLTGYNLRTKIVIRILERESVELKKAIGR